MISPTLHQANKAVFVDVFEAAPITPNVDWRRMPLTPEWYCSSFTLSSQGFMPKILNPKLYNFHFGLKASTKSQLAVGVFAGPVKIHQKLPAAHSCIHAGVYILHCVYRFGVVPECVAEGFPF